MSSISPSGGPHRVQPSSSSIASVSRLNNLDLPDTLDSDTTAKLEAKLGRSMTPVEGKVMAELMSPLSQAEEQLMLGAGKSVYAANLSDLLAGMASANPYHRR